mgnify:CR=1 FL=1
MRLFFHCSLWIFHNIGPFLLSGHLFVQLWIFFCQILDEKNLVIRETLRCLILPNESFELSLHVSVRIILLVSNNLFDCIIKLLVLLILCYFLQIYNLLFKRSFWVDILFRIPSELFRIKSLWLVPQIVCFVIIIMIFNLQVRVVNFPILLSFIIILSLRLFGHFHGPI